MNKLTLLNNLMDRNSTISDISHGKEVFWENPEKLPVNEAPFPISDSEINAAEERFQRFAPFIERVFPETQKNHGIIESELVPIPSMQKVLCAKGKLYLKMDSHLAVAGSVKARGGFYEVLKHAEDLALANNKISLTDNYEKFDTDEMRQFFSQYTVQVGSTGNLGMSIGIMSAALGFRAIVHMSSDAKAWKKNLLRQRGVKVIEYTEDYSKAVEEGRKRSALDPKSYFVDDEKSVDLFLGYAVAAKRLKTTLREKGITVDRKHPLVVYIPAGVGGAPGGITYGLTRIFGDSVKCYFAEPVNCPSVLLGMATGLFEKANVRDFGLSGKTHADGLACASPSSLVTRLMLPIVSGVFTVSDAKLYDYLRLLYSTEGIEIEPSSCAAFIGVEKNSVPETATQIVWATGGSMIPEAMRKEYLETYL